ncbi:MAG: Asp-tRNA(Asn)/Glu-tRNA(Gln) amidotransferase subunit GatC [Chlamydiota bacterium]
MFQFDRENLKNLTKLCRIHCTEKELDALATNLQSILNLIDQLQEIDTEGVPPCNHVCENAQSTLREDDAKEGLERTVFLDNSPSHVGGMIRVPTVIKF